ncbi:OmpH family outer membrane protein [Polluticoccus soli]|uniref:OmpH family outer membrane protein n=1 Tax=Polluticoccus soli TaxID=3034150 RepID=UPI0023E0919F|nr:OmpH family outer membrane protein [Flavipsychrobacter sp. JY13-12]
MKYLSLALSALALVGVIVLFATKSGNNKGGSHTHTAASATGTTGRIAYVDIDTLEANFTYLKTKREDFAKRQEGMKRELQGSAAQMQRDIQDVQRKAKAGTLTEAEYAAAERRVQQMQQSLQTREAALTEQLLKEQDEFNKELQSRLDAFLTEYNKDKGYDYILSYSRSGHILYRNKDLDITQDVIEGMNKTNMADTTTKKK